MLRHPPGMPPRVWVTEKRPAQRARRPTPPEAPRSARRALPPRGGELRPRDGERWLLAAASRRRVDPVANPPCRPTRIRSPFEEQGVVLALTCCAAGTSPSVQPRSSAPGIGSLRSKLRLLKSGKCLKLKVTFSRIVLRMLKILQVPECVLTKVVSEKTVMKHLFCLNSLAFTFAMK